MNITYIKWNLLKYNLSMPKIDSFIKFLPCNIHLLFTMYIYIYIYSNMKIPFINIYFKSLYVHPTASEEQLLGTKRSKSHSRCSFLFCFFFKLWR